MFKNLSNAELICTLENNLNKENGGLVAFLKMLADVDSRRLYVGLGYPSLFAFCTDKLKQT